MCLPPLQPRKDDCPLQRKTLAAKLYLLWLFFSLERSWAWEGDKRCAFFVWVKETCKGYVPVDWVLPGVSDYTLPDTGGLIQCKLHALQLANRRVCANDRRRWCLIAPPLFGGCWRDWLQEDLAAFSFSFRKLFWGQLLSAALVEDEQVSAQTLFCFRNDDQLVGTKDIPVKPLQKWGSSEFPSRDKQASICQRGAVHCGALPANKGKVMWKSSFRGEFLRNTWYHVIESDLNTVLLRLFN